MMPTEGRPVAQAGAAEAGGISHDQSSDTELLDRPQQALDAALGYAARGWPVFPCRWQPGPDRKKPLTPNGFKDATRDPEEITAWWRRWPLALIGVPTGQPSGINVLDIDCKKDKWGFDALYQLDRTILDDTVLAHTASGGAHVYYAMGEQPIPSTRDQLGYGLDTRGEGGYVIVPSPASGYSWDPHHALGEVALLPAPTWLIPPEPQREPAKPVERAVGLSPYAEAAVNSACHNIVGAGNGKQEETLTGEAYSIGRLAGAGAVPEGWARRKLLSAASRIPDYDTKRKWKAKDIEKRVNNAFDRGMRKPREVRYG
jgi:hypothetical protein